jgi:isopentenyl phosphate kinase
VITDRTAEVPRLRTKVLTRLAEEIAAAKPERLVVVHGAGSFGHPLVERNRIDRGVRGLRGRLDWAETQCWQNVLNVEVAATLGRAGVPAMPCQTSAVTLLRDGRIARMDVAALRGFVDAGLVPVLPGVPCCDLVRGCAILSGDAIAPYVARRLRFDLVVHATDVDGVYDADPHAVPAAARFAVIDRRTWPQVRRAVRASAAVDVTGGMQAKVGEAVRWARRGVPSRIVDADLPGRVRDALRGRPVGTLVRW